MRRFEKLRTRLLSSLKRQRTPRGSTSSASAGRRESSSDAAYDHGAGNSLSQPHQQQLHWSEARRIYSEPATREMKVDRGSSSRESSSSSSSNLTSSSVVGAASDKIKGKNMKKRNRGNAQTVLCRTCTCTSDAGYPQEMDSQCCGETDAEDDDDVFLESWEEVAAAAISTANADHSATNLSSSSGIGSLRDNVTSAASSSCNYFNPSNSPQSLSSTSIDELQRHSVCYGGVGGSTYGRGSTMTSPEITHQLAPQNGPIAALEHELSEQTGWEEWKIPSSEITLGAILQQSQMETVYRGYWHGVVHVHTRSVREVVDVIHFLDEVATLNCIRHENIQLFMGASLDMQCGTVALVMSELKGSTLSTRLHKLGHNFTAPSKTKILCQIAEGMEYLHAKGIPHGLLTSASITLHHRVCISLAPPHIRHAHRYFHPHHLTYLPPECVRQLHVDQPSRPVSPTTQRGTPTQINSTNSPTYEKSAAAVRSRVPSSPSLIAMATGGGEGSGNDSKLWKRRSDGCNGGQGQMIVGSQLRTKMVPTTAADIFAFGTIVYELISLEHPHKNLPAECLVWLVGQGRTQPVTLLPRGRFRNIISSCWRENQQKRPSFTELLVVLEENVVPISSKSVSCSSSSRLKPSRSLPSLNSASLSANHFVK